MNERLQELVDAGCDLADAGKHEPAIKMFKAATSSGAAWVNLNLGNSQLALGQYDDAIKSYTAAAAAGAGAASAWFNLYVAHDFLGHTGPAKRALQSSQEHGDVKSYAQSVINSLAADETLAARTALDRVPGDLLESRWIRLVSLLVELREGRQTFGDDSEKLLWEAAPYIEEAAVEIIAKLWRDGRLVEIRQVLALYADVDGSEDLEYLLSRLRQRGHKQAVKYARQVAQDLGC